MLKDFGILAIFLAVATTITFAGSAVAAEKEVKTSFLECKRVQKDAINGSTLSNKDKRLLRACPSDVCSIPSWSVAKLIHCLGIIGDYGRSPPVAY